MALPEQTEVAHSLNDDVARGLTLLDERWPGWWRDRGDHPVDIARLRMWDGDVCVLAQASRWAGGHPNYFMAVAELGLTPTEACRHGLNALGNGAVVRLGLLTRRWRKVITERRATDAA